LRRHRAGFHLVAGRREFVAARRCFKMVAASIACHTGSKPARPVQRNRCDGGFLELWAARWMHNRARMNVTSFLVKDLLPSWPDGARWFWDTLVDADFAQNKLRWQ
jgi:hypothetical protein